MARIFSINFLFRHQLYSALVSPRQNENDPGFAVRYLDGDMDAIFSDAQVILSPAGIIKSRICGPQNLAEAIAFSTRKAIGKHLKGDRRSDVAAKVSTKKEAR